MNSFVWMSSTLKLESTWLFYHSCNHFFLLLNPPASSLYLAPKTNILIVIIKKDIKTGR